MTQHNPAHQPSFLLPPPPIAEGAGQDLVGVEGTDASGNEILGDIGCYLRDRFKSHFKVGLGGGDTA